jgi:hypothetical protein
MQKAVKKRPGNLFPGLFQSRSERIPQLAAGNASDSNNGNFPGCEQL